MKNRSAIYENKVIDFALEVCIFTKFGGCSSNNSVLKGSEHLRI